MTVLNQGKQIIKIVARVLMVALVVVVAGLAFIFISPDYNIYFVRSGSMEPTLNVGDMVITGPIGGLLTEEIKPGTIITFQEDKSTVVTHRAVSIQGNNITTKGDANEKPDQTPVPASHVVGIYLFKVPFVGYVVSFARSKMGWFVVILIPTFMLLGLLVKDILKEAFSTNEAAPAKTPDKTRNRKAANKVFSVSDTATSAKAPDKAYVNKSTNKAFPKAEGPPTPVRNQNDARIREMLLEALGKVENRTR